MTYDPWSLSKSNSEDAHQVAIFAWANVAMSFGVTAASDILSYSVPGHAKKYISAAFDKPVPEFRWLHAIPNGGSRGDTERSRKIRGAQLKAQGVKAGVSDMCLPVKRNGFSGLYIELKKPGKIKDTSSEQDEFGEFVISQGYMFEVCDSWEKAVHLLKLYIVS